MHRVKASSRSSPLARAQVKEVEAQLPNVSFSTTYIETTGDKERTQSLREMDKTDFFTRELDHLLLNHETDIAIHSAKDLPDPLPCGLAVFALLKGVDNRDALVYKKEFPKQPLIATSSYKREENVKKLFPNAQFVDLRGTISERLETEGVDGVVVAEAALLRLGLTHLKRVMLPGKTTPYQGQLAILGRKNDPIEELFSPLDCRKKVLHVGLTPPPESLSQKAVHLPLIEIVPRKNPNLTFSAPYVLFTSQVAVELFFKQATLSSDQEIIAIGEMTAKKVMQFGKKVSMIPNEATLEGVVQLLRKIPKDKREIFWPHSARSRLVLHDFFKKEGGILTECLLYDTIYKKERPKISLEDFDQILFTSPSTVDSFFHHFKTVPKFLKWEAIGPVTEKKCRLMIELTKA